MKTTLVKFKSLLIRNIKLYFSDKLMFFVSLMGPLILLLLFILFLRQNYYSSFVNSLPEGISFANENVPNAFIAGWIVSALMSVTPITVSLGAGVIMVQDKINGTIHDLKSSPVNTSTISLSYFLATFLSAILIVFSVLGLGFIYIAISGWYLSFIDVILICLNTILLTLFGCGLSTIINIFIKSEGGITAVSALFASVYGFICGAYLPIAQFGKTFANIFGFNPGLYSSIIFKNIFTRGPLVEMSSLPNEAINGIKDAFDLNFYFFNVFVEKYVTWIIISFSVVILIILMVILSNRHRLFKNFRILLNKKHKKV